MKSFLLLPAIVLLKTSIVTAQEKKNIFTVNAGYLYSFTKVIEPPGNLLDISQIYGNPGFYIGSFYETPLSKLVVTRSEIGYQRKGYKSDFLENGSNIKKTHHLHYLSINQLVGINYLNKFSILVGPEMSFLINKPFNDQNFKKLEFGIASRVNYRINKFILSAGYFKGLSSYSRLGDNNRHFDFFNNNVRFGFNYILSK